VLSPRPFSSEKISIIKNEIEAESLLHYDNIMLDNRVFYQFYTIRNILSKHYNIIAAYPMASETCAMITKAGIFKIRYAIGNHSIDAFNNGIILHKKFLEMDPSLPKIIDVFSDGNVYCKVSEWTYGVDYNVLQRKKLAIPPLYFKKFGLYLGTIRDMFGIYIADNSAYNIIYRIKEDDLVICDFGIRTFSSRFNKLILDKLLSTLNDEQRVYFYDGYR
jgi:hypothetical protein